MACARAYGMTGQQARGAVSHYAGDAAEQRVAQDYERRGHAIAARRWRGAAGEIDLIVRDGETVVFVEVKSSRTRAQAAAALSARQMARLCASAEEFLAGEPAGGLTEMRFDVALLDASGGLEIIENAFAGD